MYKILIKNEDDTWYFKSHGNISCPTTSEFETKNEALKGVLELLKHHGKDDVKIIQEVEFNIEIN